MINSDQRACLLGLFAVVLGGVIVGCGGSSAPVVGADVGRGVHVVRGQRVDVAPEILGGYATVDSLKSYPRSAAADGAYGVIWLQCTVSASGICTRIQLAQGGHPALETEALNVLQQLEFRPGTSNGAPVPVLVQIPVIFQGPYARPEEEEES